MVVVSGRDRRGKDENGLGKNMRNIFKVICGYASEQTAKPRLSIVN